MPYKNKEKQIKYQEEYHKKTWQQRKSKHKNKKRERIQKNREWYIEYKKNISCKCGESHPSCLDFHHINNDKEFNIGDMIGQGYSVKTIKKEIDKCEVICKNCHAKLHYRE